MRKSVWPMLLLCWLISLASCAYYGPSTYKVVYRTAPDGSRLPWRPPSPEDDAATQDTLLREFWDRVVIQPRRPKRVCGIVTDPAGAIIRDVDVDVVRMLQGDMWKEYSRKSVPSRVHLSDGHFDINYRGWDAMALTFIASDGSHRYAQASFSSFFGVPRVYTPENAAGSLVLGMIVPDSSDKDGVRMILRTTEEWSPRRHAASEASVSYSRRGELDPESYKLLDY